MIVVGAVLGYGGRSIATLFGLKSAQLDQVSFIIKASGLFMVLMGAVLVLFA